MLSAGMVSACEKCLDALETAVDKRGDKTAATQLQVQDVCIRPGGWASNQGTTGGRDRYGEVNSGLTSLKSEQS